MWGAQNCGMDIDAGQNDGECNIMQHILQTYLQSLLETSWQRICFVFGRCVKCHFAELTENNINMNNRIQCVQFIYVQGKQEIFILD